MRWNEVSFEQAGWAALRDRKKWAKLDISRCTPGERYTVRAALPVELQAFLPWKPLKGRSERAQKRHLVKCKDSQRPQSTGHRLSVPWASSIRPQQLQVCPSFPQVWPVPWLSARETRWSTQAWTVFTSGRREQDRYTKTQTKAWLAQTEGDGTPPLRKAKCNNTSHPLRCCYFFQPGAPQGPCTRKRKVSVSLQIALTSEEKGPLPESSVSREQMEAHDDSSNILHTLSTLSDQAQGHTPLIRGVDITK